MDNKRTLHHNDGDDRSSPRTSKDNHTALTIGYTATDWRQLRGRTPPVGSLRSFAGLSASYR
mgnify:FL=1|jgi:hypothetical protein